MILYCDASALVKLYVAEPASAQVRQWVDEALVVATSEVAYVEVVSALMRRVREHSVSQGGYEAAIDGLDRDWPSFVRLRVDPEHGAALVARHVLGAPDSLHVAAALALSSAAPDNTVAMCTFDARQRAAAVAEGLTVLEPA